MDRFVIGSGRCGSTLLSAMLHEDSDLLSISEFFVGLQRERRFHQDSADPQRFADLLSRGQLDGLNFTRRGIIVPEILYPFDSPGARFNPENPTPWVLQITLPALTEDHEALFDALIDHCRALPRQPLADQYRSTFRWLADRRGASAWVERSGSSLEYAAELVDLFPAARYLHLHRDGHESALSMREHAAFRYRVAFLYEIPDQDGVRYSFMRSYDPTQGPSASQDLTDILSARAPVEFFGRYWTDQLATGYKVISRLDSDQYLEMSFEDLIADTEGCLEGIADFFELPGDRRQARKRATELVRGNPPTRFDALTNEEQEALSKACLPGMRQLGRA
jgi:hypothetical protein